MKTRDELAEVFVVSVLRTFGPDDSAEWEAVVKDGFNLADAFVAERERRAVDRERVPAEPPGGWSAPAETARPVGRWFRPDGTMLNRNGDWSSVTLDGEDAHAGDTFAAVSVRADSREHAERIVAAMLPVGRGTP